jgi:hypothetical protein
MTERCDICEEIDSAIRYIIHLNLPHYYGKAIEKRKEHTENAHSKRNPVYLVQADRLQTPDPIK